MNLKVPFKEREHQRTLLRWCVDLSTLICQGALGALTFGAYYQYTTNKTMELNNEKIETQYKHFMDKMENQHKKEMIEMLNALNEAHSQLRSICGDD